MWKCIQSSKSHYFILSPDVQGLFFFFYEDWENKTQSETVGFQSSSNVMSVTWKTRASVQPLYCQTTVNVRQGKYFWPTNRWSLILIVFRWIFSFFSFIPTNHKVCADALVHLWMEGAQWVMCLSSQPQAYLQQAQDLVILESIILQTLGKLGRMSWYPWFCFPPIKVWLEKRR